MGRLFAIIFASLLVLYLGLELTLQRHRPGASVRMRWATDDSPSRKQQLAVFLKMHPEIDLIVDPGDYNKRIVQCATRTGPDIIDIYTIGDMFTYIQAGILEDLTPYARSMGFGPDRIYPAITGALGLGSGEDFRQYRYPCNVWVNCVIYHKGVFDSLKIPYPTPEWTYDDFVRIGRTIRERSGGACLAVANSGIGANVYLFKDILIGHGGRFFARDGLTSAFDSPQALAAARRYYDLMHVHDILLSPSEAAALSSQGGWGTGGFVWFANGKAAMVIAGRWFLVFLANYPGLAQSIGAVTLPHAGNLPSSGMIDARGAGINSRSPHKKQALQFLQFLASPEYSAQIARDGDAQPPRNDLYTTGEGLAAESSVRDPAFHQAFIDAMVNARPVDYSPFMDAGPTERWVKERLDAIDNLDPENPRATPEEIMRGLAREVNRQIRINIERRPELQRKYREVTGKAWEKKG